MATPPPSGSLHTTSVASHTSISRHGLQVFPKSIHSGRQRPARQFTAVERHVHLGDKAETRERSPTERASVMPCPVGVPLPAWCAARMLSRHRPAARRGLAGSRHSRVAWSARHTSRRLPRPASTTLPPRHRSASVSSRSQHAVSVTHLIDPNEVVAMRTVAPSTQNNVAPHSTCADRRGAAARLPVPHADDRPRARAAHRPQRRHPRRPAQ